MSASLSSLPDTARPKAARCRHFGSCGGCSIQDRDYQEQISLKSLRVGKLLSELGVEIARVHPSPDIWHYRNKMEFSFGDVYPPVAGGPTVLLGLKPKGQWHKILDLKECHLLSAQAPALLEAVRAWAESNAVLPYNSRRHTGFMRHLVVREAKNSPDRLVSLITAAGDFPRDSFLDAVRRVYPATTVLRGINGKLSDTALSDRLEILDGPGHITEILRFPGQELKFRISPQSFFQTNTRGAEVLYGILRAWVQEAGARKVLDLYCGGGGITLSLAGVCEEIVGAEVNASAVEDARANADRNGVGNAKFYSGMVETLIPALLDLGADAAVVDPPRAGLHAKALSALEKQGPTDLFYVSCNPEALARDLSSLKERYSVRRAEIVDLFPHTEHVETAVWLGRRA